MAVLVFSLPYLSTEWEFHLGGEKIAPDREHYAVVKDPSTFVVDRLPCGVILAPPSTPAPGTIVRLGCV